jgi:hypothetical protein
MYRFCTRWCSGWKKNSYMIENIEYWELKELCIWTLDIYRLDHPLKRRLETLKELSMGSWFANIVSSESFTQHEMPTLPVTHHHMEEALSGVQTSRNSVVAPREVLTVTPRYATLMVLVHGSRPKHNKNNDDIFLFILVRTTTKSIQLFINKPEFLLSFIPC